MRNGMHKCDLILAPLFLLGAGYFVWDCIKDLRRGENRPKVTDAMIDEAFEQQLMARSDEELAEMDWIWDED